MVPRGIIRRARRRSERSCCPREPTMSAITLDAPTSSLFRGQSSEVVLLDEAGHVLGRFVPGSGKPYNPPPLSEEEIQRRLQGPRYSTAEVLASLHNTGES